MMEKLRALIMGLGIAGYAACSGSHGGAPPAPPTLPTPAPEVHEPVCVPPGLIFGCWHQPPGQGWIFIQAPEAPVPAGCVIAGLPGSILPTPDATSSKAVNETLAEVTGCSIGSRCVLRVGQQAFHAHVNAALRAKGLCAGQHEPNSDEIAVSTGPAAIRQSYKIYMGFQGDGPIPPGEVERTVVWFPGGARQAYLPGVSDVSGDLPPAPTPSPSPAPGPSPTPAPAPPTSDACPIAPCPIREWTRETLPEGWGDNEIGRPAYKINSTTYAGGPDRDTTPVVKRQLAFCQSIGFNNPNEPPRAECPVRPDGHPEREAVERWLLYGGFVRQGRNGETAESCAPRHDNPAMFHEGTGNCRQCNARPNGDPLQVCTDWY